MNISKFTKPVLWVIMLSACAQTFPMTRLAANPRLLQRLGNGVAVVGTVAPVVAGGTKLASLSAQAENTNIQDQNISIEAQNVAPENVVSQEQSVEQPLTAVSTPETSQESDASSNVSEGVQKAAEVAQDASEDLQNGNVTDPKELGTTTEELTKFQEFKKFVVEKATDKEFLKQGFCGVVTLTSGIYLLHKSGVLVKVKKHWVISSLTAAGLLTAGGAAAYFAPDMMKKVAQATLSGATNPYTAIGFAATAGAVYAGSKFENNWKKAGAGLTTGGAIAGLGVAHELGYLDWAKKGLYNGASYVAQKGASLASTFAAYAQENPKTSLAIAGGTLATAGVAGFGARYGYKWYTKLSPEQAEAAYVQFTNNVLANRTDFEAVSKLIKEFKALNMDRTEQMNGYITILENFIAAKKQEEEQRLAQNQAPAGQGWVQGQNGVWAQAVPVQEDANNSVFTKVTSGIKNAVNRWTIGTGVAALAGTGLYGAYKKGYLYPSWMRSVATEGQKLAAPYVEKASEKVGPYIAKATPVLTNKWVAGSAAGIGLLGATYVGINKYQAYKKSSAQEASRLATEEAVANYAAKLSHLAQQHWNKADELVEDLRHFSKLERTYAFGPEVVELKKRMSYRIAQLRAPALPARPALRQQQVVVPVQRQQVAPQVVRNITPAQQPQRNVVAPVQRQQVAPQVVRNITPAAQPQRNVVAPVVNNKAQVAAIPALLDKAARGDHAALAQAKADAGSDKAFVTMIGNYMNSDVARFIGNHKQGLRPSKAKLAVYYNKNKALIDGLAAKCGVSSASLIGL